jgi:hypothetical protein
MTDRRRMALQMVVEATLEVTPCLVQTRCVIGESIASETGCRYILLSLHIIREWVPGTNIADYLISATIEAVKL